MENLQIVASNGNRNSKILALKGPLSIRTVFTLQDTMRAETSSPVILDFSGVPFIDSAGLGALVGAHISAKKSNRQIVLASLNEQAKALIDMTNLNRLFLMFPTVQEAEAALA
jgi:anti-sigma B factor antagonist